MSASQRVLAAVIVSAIVVLWALWVYTGRGLPLEQRYATKWRVAVERQVEDPLLGTHTETSFTDRFVFGVDWAIRGSALLSSFLLGGLAFHAIRAPR
jgi:hypothetical protein